MRLILPMLYLLFSIPAKSVSAIDEVGLADRNGQQLQIQSLHFTDENNAEVSLGLYFKPKTPVLLTLIYYGCPALCTIVLNDLTKALKQTGLVAGDAYELVVVSINPDEDSVLAQRKKLSYLKAMELPPDSPGFHFLVGKQPDIESLSQRVGFNFKYNRDTHEFEHPAAVFVISPTGVLTRTLTEVGFRPRDLHIALAEAESGKALSTLSRMVIYCKQTVLRRPVWYRVVAGICGMLAGLFCLILSLRYWRRRKGAATSRSLLRIKLGFIQRRLK